MWMVYTKEDGVVLVTDNKEEALKVYEKEKVKDRGYYEQNEELEYEFIDTILAEINSRHFFKPVQVATGKVKYKLTEEKY